jgi:hypothetical protein
MREEPEQTASPARDTDPPSAADNGSSQGKRPRPLRRWSVAELLAAAVARAPVERTSH